MAYSTIVTCTGVLLQCVKDTWLHAEVDIDEVDAASSLVLSLFPDEMVLLEWPVFPETSSEDTRLASGTKVQHIIIQANSLLMVINKTTNVIYIKL